MKKFRKIYFTLLSTFLANTSFASEMSVEFQTKIADALKNQAMYNNIILDQNNIIDVEVDGEVLEIDENLISTLEENGFINRDIVASAGERCIGKTE